MGVDKAIVDIKIFEKIAHNAAHVNQVTVYQLSVREAEF
jgi:hypothetical protein